MNLNEKRLQRTIALLLGVCMIISQIALTCFATIGILVMTSSETVQDEIDISSTNPTEEDETAPTEPSEPSEPTIPETEPTEASEPIETTEPEPTEVTEPEPTNPSPTELPNPEFQYYDIPLSKDLQKYIYKLCEENGINHVMVLAMIRRESNYNIENIGDNGDSLGLMQIQPKWHQKRMDKLGCPNLLDPYQNVKVGIDYLVELYGYYGGRPTEWVLMAYNGGPRYAEEKWSNGEVTKYVTKVFEFIDILIKEN